VQYLREYAVPQEAAGRIRYRTTVTATSRNEADAQYPFTLSATTEPGARLATYRCKVVVVATGLSTPNSPPSVAGIELAQGYEQVPETGESFEKQSVLVLGLGNAGFEIANALSPHVNFVHVIPGRPPKGSGMDRHAFLSWESRCVPRMVDPQHRH
jgi:cation diffusion facilitator CzcD-associated flavoprotein CzcO